MGGIMSIAYVNNYDTYVHSQNINALETVTFDGGFNFSGIATTRWASGFFAQTTGFNAGGTTVYLDDIFYHDNFGNNFLTYDLNQFIDLTSNNVRLNFSEVFFSDRNDYFDPRLVGGSSTSTINITLDGNAIYDFAGGIDHAYVDNTFNGVSVTTSAGITTIDGTQTRNLENVILNDGIFSLSQLTSRNTDNSTSNNSSFGNFSNLVDEAFYNARNADVAAAGVDPEAHYYSNGHLEGRVQTGGLILAFTCRIILMLQMLKMPAD